MNRERLLALIIDLDRHACDAHSVWQYLEKQKNELSDEIGLTEKEREEHGIY